MHQTFYVDIDEEVNSVISRLRKSTSQYNILVIAQQALILQSSVSLRLIKKEMDSLKKKVMIVTQDEHGLAVAKKAGFPVKKTMDEVKQIKEATVLQTADISQKNDAVDMEKESDKNELALNERNRLRNLGDNKYVVVDDVAIREPIQKKKKDGGYDKKRGLNMNKTEERELDNLFAEKIGESDVLKESNSVTKGAGKFLWMFALVSLVLLAGIFTYLFLPRAEINLIPKEIQKNINLTIKAQEDIQEGEALSDVIKLKSTLVEEDDLLNLTFDTTGQKASANKKARGTITIYNNFSEASQILVATTRFLSEDGKLFRLIKAVTVPGMKVADGENTAGEIKAEVIADQSGEEYNIDSTTFKIPGFEGGPKYEKFSAKSEDKMKGGGEGESELKTVSQTDIDNAKKETLEKIKSQLSQKIKEKAGNENVFLDDTVEYEILDFASFPEVGAIADDFEYQIKVKARYLTFSVIDLNEKINKYIRENLQQEFPMEVISVDKKYGKSKSDFSNNSVEMKLAANIRLEAKINSEDIKQELLGKNQGEVDGFMVEHPEIQKIDATILPNFLASRIPKYSSRVEINISNQQ